MRSESTLKKQETGSLNPSSPAESAPDPSGAILNDVPDELRGVLEKDPDKNFLKILSAMEYRGPLPLPDMLRDYENVVPGSAQQIIEWGDREQKHRHEVESKMVNTESRDSLLGIVGAVFISTLLIVGGIIVILSLRTTTGTVVGGLINAGGIATVIGAFLKGTSASWRNSDRSSRNDLDNEDNPQ